MRVIFLGTPAIASSVLTALIDLNLDIVCVVCQPDKQKNRKKQPVYSSVKLKALAANLNLIQPVNINDEYEYLKSLKPDIIITCAYGQFIKKPILELPKYKCINLHASILPKYRGGAPIHYAIINGEHKTGISLMEMQMKMDAGPVLKTYEVEISNTDTYSSLYKKLAQLCYQIITSDFHILTSDNIQFKDQVGDPTFAYNIKKEQTFIDFNQSVKQVYNFIRGLNDKPLAKICHDNLVYKVYESIKTNYKSTNVPGYILKISPQGMQVCTTDYDILITIMQKPAKNPSHIKDLINGNFNFKVGDIIKLPH